MSGSAATPEPPAPGEGVPSVAARFALYQRAGGIVTPALTAVLAFFIGGLIVLATGRDPIGVYKGIIQGAGLDWFVHIHLTSHFPWIWEWHSAGPHCNTGACVSAYNLQQTLLTMTTLILTGLAVAFAFRCGLFNIGGQGQYFVGVIVSAWVGASWVHLAGAAHIFLVIVLATLAGAVWAGIAGLLKALVGAHEVITTIMLNWIALYIGTYLVGEKGPLNTGQPGSIASKPVASSTLLPSWWGEAGSQTVHVGFFIALAMLVVFWLLLNRTTLGYEVRAVGYNPEAARYGGISVARSYFMAMAISGAFAGLAGALDILGSLYKYGFSTQDFQNSSVGFIGIAVALLGRNTAVGVGVAAFLFGALLYGTSTTSAAIQPPELAGNLTLMIQAFVLLFIGADVLILSVWRARRRLRRRTSG